MRSMLYALPIVLLPLVPHANASSRDDAQALHMIIAIENFGVELTVAEAGVASHLGLPLNRQELAAVLGGGHIVYVDKASLVDLDRKPALQVAALARQVVLDSTQGLTGLGTIQVPDQRVVYLCPDKEFGDNFLLSNEIQTACGKGVPRAPADNDPPISPSPSIFRTKSMAGAIR